MTTPNPSATETQSTNSAQQQAAPAGRTRTFTWTDNGPTVAAARSMSGLEFLRLPQAARCAPISECLDFSLVQADEGRTVFELIPAEFHYNPLGTVHGGLICTLCDSAAGAAVHSTLKQGEAYTSLEIKVNFLRPVTAATGPLRCEGQVLSRGSRIALAEARLLDRAGKVYAHATSTCMILSLEPGNSRA